MTYCNWHLANQSTNFLCSPIKMLFIVPFPPDAPTATTSPCWNSLLLIIVSWISFSNVLKKHSLHKASPLKLHNKPYLQILIYIYIYIYQILSLYIYIYITNNLTTINNLVASSLLNNIVGSTMLLTHDDNVV